MLTLELPGEEFFDPATNEFTYAEGRVLHLEHSLLSLSKWEMKWKKPFLNSKKTSEETLDYVRCMCEEDVDTLTLARLTADDWQRIEAHINDPMTATTFGKDKGPTRTKKTTSEEIYFLMAHYGIPFECEKWHFGRLMTLLRICAIRNGGQKKMSSSEALKRQAALNAARRAKSGSRG
jgi:hypothetical protein